MSAAGAKIVAMPDISAMLLRSRVGSLGSGRPHCSSCRRTPLTGERLAETVTGRLLCELCVGSLPEAEREFVRTERVHASERHIAPSPRAA